MRWCSWWRTGDSPKHVKAISLQAWGGPEGSRRFRLPDFKTISTWMWYAPATFTPRKYSWYSFLLEAESTLGPQCDRKDYVNEKFQRHQRESNPDLPACSAVPQPTACPTSETCRAKYWVIKIIHKKWYISLVCLHMYLSSLYGIALYGRLLLVGLPQSRCCFSFFFFFLLCLRIVT